MKGAGPQILGTRAKFKRVPCQKSCRVNRAKVLATFLFYRDKMPQRESMVKIVSHFSEGIRFLRGFFSLDTTVNAAMAIIY